MKRHSRSWTVPMPDGSFQEWGHSWLEPENWRDRLILWWRSRQRRR
jgi:hypothetical protein